MKNTASFLAVLLVGLAAYGFPLTHAGDRHISDNRATFEVTSTETDHVAKSSIAPEIAKVKTSEVVTSEPKELRPAKEMLSPQTAYADMVSVSRPVKLIIPSIALEAPIQNVGLNDKGEMGVPDGKTTNVGWYEYGTLPGEIGSAVLAAHVFAAFKDLHNVKAGSDIYVVTESGAKLRFIVEESTLQKLEDISAEKLFNRSDEKRLNLITCEGAFSRKAGTYDHRRIIYAKFVGMD